MAGFRVYSFDWNVFADLTTNPESAIPEALGERLADEKTRKTLALPSKLPRTREKLSALIRDLFLEPEWYADQPASSVELRHRLLFAMFFENALESIGLSATPAWRAFYDCCDFNTGSLLAGQATIPVDRVNRSKGKTLYIQYTKNAKPDDNAFWWFGNRPYRYRAWQGTNEDQEEFEEKFEFSNYSIQSPEEVNTLWRQFEEKSKQLKEEVECKELEETLADYQHCLETVRTRNAGMLVEIDT